MRKMKDSGVEWIGQIPEDWKLERFQWHITEIKETNKPEKSRRVLSLTNKRGVIPYEEKGAQGNVAKEDYTQYKLAYPGTIVANSMNILIGSVGRCDYFGCVSPVYYVFKPNEGENLEFINYLFLMEQFQKELRRYANGILEIRLRVSAEGILKRIMAFPPIDEQKRIVSFLDQECGQVDTLIANVQTQKEKLKAYKQSLITEVVTKGLDPTVPMKDSGVEWIGKIPSAWSTIRVKQLLCERKERSFDGSEVPLSMSQKLGLVPTIMLDSIPNVASSFVGAKLAYINDLVFNKLKAHLGVFSVSKYDGLVSPDYAVYYSTGVADLKYLEYLFKTPQCISEFRKKSTGIAAGLTRLYTDGLFSIECPFPAKDEQAQIVEYLNGKCEKIERLITIKQAKIDKLSEYKKSLIYEYVTGKKEVPVG